MSCVDVCVCVFDGVSLRCMCAFVCVLKIAQLQSRKERIVGLKIGSW